MAWDSLTSVTSWCYLLYFEQKLSSLGSLLQTASLHLCSSRIGRHCVLALPSVTEWKFSLQIWPDRNVQWGLCVDFEDLSVYYYGFLVSRPLTSSTRWTWCYARQKMWTWLVSCNDVWETCTKCCRIRMKWLVCKDIIRIWCCRWCAEITFHSIKSSHLAPLLQYCSSYNVKSNSFEVSSL